jgi:hypothetical protein
MSSTSTLREKLHQLRIFVAFIGTAGLGYWKEELE